MRLQAGFAIRNTFAETYSAPHRIWWVASRQRKGERKKGREVGGGNPLWINFWLSALLLCDRACVYMLYSVKHIGKETYTRCHINVICSKQQHKQKINSIKRLGKTARLTYMGTDGWSEKKTGPGGLSWFITNLFYFWQISSLKDNTVYLSQFRRWFCAWLSVAVKSIRFNEIILLLAYVRNNCHSSERTLHTCISSHRPKLSCGSISYTLTMMRQSIIDWSQSWTDDFQLWKASTQHHFAVIKFAELHCSIYFQRQKSYLIGYFAGKKHTVNAYAYRTNSIH